MNTDFEHDGPALIPVLEQLRTRTWNDEDALQRHIHELLTAVGIESEREWQLSDGKSRVDIFIPRPERDRMLRRNGIAVEVKVAGSASDALRQLERYSRCDEVFDLVLVTTKAAHIAMPRLLEWKPLTVIPLLEGGL